MRELPQGWAIFSFDDVTLINPRHSRGLPKNIKVTFTPMPAISDSSPRFNFTESRELASVIKGFTHYAEGDVLFAKITPSMENGKGGVALGLEGGLGCGTTELHVLRPLYGIDSKYIYYFLHQESFRNEAARHMTGTAGQLRVPVEYLRAERIPVAPLNEQKRIVAKLEKLLSKVNTCRERLDKIPSLLKRFRQSVLAAACSGRLTEDWRQKNAQVESGEDLIKCIVEKRKNHAGKRRMSEQPEQSFYYPEIDFLDIWNYASLDELFFITSGEAFKKSEYSNAGLKLFQIANVGFGKTLWDQQHFLPIEFRNTHAHLLLKKGDICIALNRPILNNTLKVAVLDDDDMPSILYQRVGRLRPVEDNIRDYVFLYMCSDYFRKLLENELVGSDQPFINMSQLRKMAVPFPPLEEQKEIVRRVEALFKKADTIEARYKKAKVYVDRLTQSILAKAFRGELVPQDPDDEPASELLKRNLSRQGAVVLS